MSFTITWPDVVKVDASLHCISAAVQAAILADVEAQLSETNLSGKYDLACKYLAAHMGVLQLANDAQMPSGPVTSESVGSVSRSYASVSGGKMSDAWLTSTKHGLAYLRTIRNSLARLPIL